MAVETVTENLPVAEGAKRPARSGYVNALLASFGHVVVQMARQQRLIFVSAIAFLPVLLPLSMAFLSNTKYAGDGLETFVRLAELLHIDALSPLLALFFATMLIGEDVEAQTIPYVLTRPVPRSAWVLGRFGAYLAVVSVIMAVSLALTFAACTTMEQLSFNPRDLTLLAQFGIVMLLSLAGYGALTVFLGAFVRRPVVVGVVFIYGWQYVALYVPGLIDFLTIRKYTDVMLPKLAVAGANEKVQTALGEFQRQIYLESAVKATVILLLISAVLLGLTIVTVRVRQYATSHAVGG